MEDQAGYLHTLSPVQLKKLYEVSQLPKGHIDSDFVAGYWAMWAGWPYPRSYSEAMTGWLEAVEDHTAGYGPDDDA